MLKKSLLSLAIAAGLGLAGCSGTDSSGSTGPNGGNPNQPGGDAANKELVNAIKNGGVHPIFNPGASDLPPIIDLLYRGTAGPVDGTFNFAKGEGGANVEFGGVNYNPVFNAVADLTGASTTAQFDIELNGAVNAATVIPNTTVFVVELNNSGDPVLDLSAGNLVDADNPITGLFTSFETSVINPEDLLRTSGDNHDTRGRIRITPTAPLNPKTRYLVVLTAAIQDNNGNSILPSVSYDALGSSRNTATSALVPVQGLVRGWENLAYGTIYASQFLSDGSQPDDIPVPGEATTCEPNPDPTYVTLSNLVAVATTLGIDTSNYDLNPASEGFAAGFAQLAADTETAAKATFTLTYSFTTGGTNEVLSAMASPYMLQESLIDTVENTVVAQALEEKIEETGDQCAELTAEELAAAQAQGDAAGRAVVVPALNERAAREMPTAQTVEITNGPYPTMLLNAALTNSLFYTGTIELPYYSTKPGFIKDTAIESVSSAADPALKLTAANVIGAKWQADTTFATTIDYGSDSLNAIAQGLQARSDLVTRLFPIANRTSTLKAPVTVFTPTDAACAGNYKTVIYQHGITTNRYASMAMADTLAAATVGAEQGCVVTIAIDLALHGIEPADGATLIDTSVLDGTPYDGTYDALNGQPMLAIKSPLSPATIQGYQATWAAAGLTAEQISAATLSAYLLSENHFGLTNDGTGKPRAMSEADIADGDNESGSLFINLLNHQVTRDSMRQSVMNLMNLNASLGDLNTTLNTYAQAALGLPGAPDYIDSANPNFIGHSLGSIIGTTFVSVNNTVGNANVLAAGGNSCAVASPAGCGNASLAYIDDAILANGGASVPKLVESSPAFSGSIIGGLGALGVYQRSYSYETLLNVFQATLQSVDPITFSSNYSSSVLMNGGVFTTDTLVHKVNGDQVVPNNGRNEVGTEIPTGIEGISNFPLPAPLAGTDAKMEMMCGDATYTESDNTGAALNGACATAAHIDVLRTGGTHSTFGGADNPTIFGGTIVPAVIAELND